MSDQATVLAAIRDEPCSRPEDLASDLGWSIAEVNAAVALLLAAGLVHLSDRGLVLAPPADARRGAHGVLGRRAVPDACDASGLPDEAVSAHEARLREIDNEIGRWLDAQGRW